MKVSGYIVFSLVNGPSDLFESESTGPVSSEGGEERAAMEDEDRERGAEREERENSIICHIHTVTDVHLLHG